MRIHLSSLTRGFFVVAAAALLAACGGGGAAGPTPSLGPGPVITPVPTNTPTPTATPAPSYSATVHASGTTLSIAPAESVNASVQFAAATSGAGATVTGSISDFPPANVPAPAARTRHAISHTAVLYVVLTANAAVQFAAGSHLIFNGITPDTYDLASYTSAFGWHYDIAETSTDTSTLDFDLSSGFGLSSTPLVFALTTDSGTADFTLSPASMDLQGVGTAYNASFTASEAFYTGTFTAASGNTTVATVSAGSSGSDFTVTPVAPGFTYIHVTDSHGYVVDLPVTVE